MIKSLKDESVLLYLDRGNKDRTASLQLCIDLLKLNGFILLDNLETYVIHHGDVIQLMPSAHLKPFSTSENI